MACYPCTRNSRLYGRCCSGSNQARNWCADCEDGVEALIFPCCCEQTPMPSGVNSCGCPNSDERIR